jgi:hypothetical protein
VLESVDTTILGRDLAHELGGTPDHFIQVLDDQVIDLPRAQKRFGNSVQLVVMYTGRYACLTRQAPGPGRGCRRDL